MSIKAYGYDSYGGPDTQDWFDLDEPTPGPSEVLVRVKAIGVNPVDWKIRQGHMADPNADPALDGAFPRVLGIEAAGVVEAVGADVDGIAVGDAVFGSAAANHGTYAELAVLDGSATAVKPPQLGFDAAAAVPVSGVTALAALDQLGLGEGDTLLVSAAGGSVGVVLLQLARDRGVAVFGVASESKRAMVESLGAVLVPYDAATSVVDQMRALLPGGVDAVVDLVGNPSLSELAVLVKNPQRILSGVEPGVTDLGGSEISQDRPVQMLETVARLMVEGKVDPKITGSYPFDEAATALAAVEAGHQLGKVVIDLTQTTAT